MSDELVTTRPGFLPEVTEGRGNVGMDAEDLKIPWIFLTHEKTDDSEAGQYIDSLTKQPYTEPLRFIPIFYFKQYRKKQGKETMFTTRDRNDERIKAGELEWDGKKPPEVQTELVFFVMMPDTLELCKVSFYRTSYDAGKNLLNFFRRFKGDIFERAYDLGAQAKGEYFIKTVKPGAFVTEEQYKAAGEAYEQVKAIAAQGGFTSEDDESKPDF